VHAVPNWAKAPLHEGRPPNTNRKQFLKVLLKGEAYVNVGDGEGSRHRSCTLVASNVSRLPTFLVHNGANDVAKYSLGLLSLRRLYSLQLGHDGPLPP
jgi:hypothetical protein